MFPNVVLLLDVRVVVVAVSGVVMVVALAVSCAITPNDWELAKSPTIMPTIAYLKEKQAPIG